MSIKNVYITRNLQRKADLATGVKLLVVNMTEKTKFHKRNY